MRPSGPNIGRRPAPALNPGEGSATVIPNAQGGVRLRTGPGTNHPVIAVDGSPLLPFNGETVAVVATGLPADDGQGGEWWRVRSSGNGEGFARAVERRNGITVSNFSLVTAPNGGMADNYPPNPNPLPPPPPPPITGYGYPARRAYGPRRSG